jgi:NADH pyrophosphatase NudC (nudix superfamily)
MGFESSKDSKYVQEETQTEDGIRIQHLRVRESQEWLVTETYFLLFIVNLRRTIEINKKEIRVEKKAKRERTK